MSEEERISLAKWESQVRKGTLDFMILLCLAKEEYYGYDLIRSIKLMANLDISEGTIYPLLNRLKEQRLISSTWIAQEKGIPRKYYRITPRGCGMLERMKSSWIEFDKSLRALMEEGS